MATAALDNAEGLGDAAGMDTSYPSLLESMGLRPFSQRLRQALVVLRGMEDVPPSKLGVSSLGTLRPRMAFPLWWGRSYRPRTVLLTHLFNHRQTPIEDGWSVRRTQMEDFRGGTLTYDSHNGTDLSIPRGTLAVAPAAGVVARVFSEFHRGGNKVVIDHGGGLLTCSAHLARPLVREGDTLVTGQPYAVTGYSGLDGFATFPWGVPHIHFNVWLNGEPVDPFGRDGEASLWREGWPTPVPSSTPVMGAGDAVVDEPPVDAASLASEYEEARVDELIRLCKTATTRDRLSATGPLHLRGAQLISDLCYYPTRFPEREGMYLEPHARRPRLHLPFLERDFDAVAFADEL